MKDLLAAPVQKTQSAVHLQHLRWYICGLLFLATTINYVDRQVIGLLKPVLEKELAWTEASYGWIVFGFQLAYALMMPFAGRMIDWLGTRLGYMLAVIVWSVAAMGHAVVRSALQFGMARFALGLGESANFPAAIKTVADWFPARERALATGLFNSGANLGAIIAPLVVPYLALNFGWRSAFLATGATGFLWVILWLWLFREPDEHPLLSREERALIQSGRDTQPAARVPYSHLLASREAWALLAAKFLTDPVWWFYLFWLPGFLNRTYGLDLANLGLPVIVVYQASTIGSIAGGWLSSALLKSGWSVNAARKTAMLLCAIAAAAGVFVIRAGGNLWLAVALIGIAAAGHQGWSANLYTLASDLFPMSTVGSVVGLAGLGGAVGGMLVSPMVGYWLDFSHGAYGPLFACAGSLYLIALGVIHWLVPKVGERA